MHAQILDIDYILPNGKPVIRIFCKDENGKTICAFFENYLPYFYVKGEGLEKVLEGETNVYKIERVKVFLPIGYQKEKTEVFKVTLYNPAKTPELREKLVSKGFDVFEADIPFKFRFMADHNLNGMDWIDIEDKSPMETSVVYADKKIKAEKLKPIEKMGNAPLRILAFDIECISLKEGLVPDPEKDPIIMISFVFSEPYKGKNSMILATRYDPDIEYFETESDMLKAFIDIMIEYDPDIITGYNCKNFDLPYITERMKRNNILPIFGRCSRKQVVSRKISSKYKTDIVGRIIIDSFEIVKKDFSLKRYDLGFVANVLLNEKKDPVKHSQIETLWKSANKEEFKKLIEYCKKDSILAMNLITKLNLIDKYIALAKVSGTLLQDVLDSGESTRIENLLLREFNKNGYIIPCKPDEKEIAKRESMKKKELKGGFVIEPKKGIHQSVLVLDFKSMYPSIIISYNICPTTLITKDNVENPIVSPSGSKFAPENVRKGIVPILVKRLIDERRNLKKKLKNETNKEKAREYNTKQWALKIMANAFYGYFGYSRAKIYSLEIANSITSFGREVIKQTKESIENDFKYEVIYGDTDSLMIKVDKENLDEMQKIGETIAENITKKLPGVIELEFQRIFKRFLPLTKKRYAAWSFEKTNGGWKESIETKGIETIRRDWCDLVSESLEKIIETILKENKTSYAVEHFKKIANELANGKIPIQKLIITKTMTKKADSYAGIQPHAELVKKIKKRSPTEAPGIGDRIGYVIVKGTQLVSKRAEDPLYVIEKNLEIDPQYYIENQLLPPLERIFDAIGVSKTELLGKGRQVQIFKVLKKKEATISAVDGFICKKCNRFYSRPTLSGICECGGILLFSSSYGPVEKVTFDDNL
ncbi:MAG: DNA polymerase domain-containing protein [Candidatus Aenigmatarchaeota archaeon]